MPRPGRDLQRSSRGHHRGRECNGCLCPVGVAMAEVGDDETVTLLFARNDRPERPSIGRLCLCTAPRIATMSLVAGSAASRPYSSESPPSFRDEQAAHSPLFGQSGAISRETASITASLRCRAVGGCGRAELWVQCCPGAGDRLDEDEDCGCVPSIRQFAVALGLPEILEPGFVRGDHGRESRAGWSARGGTRRPVG